MNILKLERVDGEKVCYLYQPEGSGDYGEIVFDLASQAFTIARIASKDTGSRYANKAAAKVTEFVRSKNLPMEYTQAWY